MPTYTYACEGCGTEFEAFQGIKEAPLTSHIIQETQETCEGPMRRLLYPVGHTWSGGAPTSKTYG